MIRKEVVSFQALFPSVQSCLLHQALRQHNPFPLPFLIVSCCSLAILVFLIIRLSFRPIITAVIMEHALSTGKQIKVVLTKS